MFRIRISSIVVSKVVHPGYEWIEEGLVQLREKFSAVATIEKPSVSRTWMVTAAQDASGSTLENSELSSGDPLFWHRVMQDQTSEFLLSQTSKVKGLDYSKDQ